MSNTYYGEFGGQFVSESLMNTLAELEKAFDEAIKDPKFIADYNYYLKEYVGNRRRTARCCNSNRRSFI